LLHFDGDCKLSVRKVTTMKVRAVLLSLVVGFSLALGWASSGRMAFVDVSNSPDLWNQV